MAVKSTQEQLEEVQAAISAVMSGQSFSSDGVSYNRANLDSLQKREEYLLAKYYKEKGKRNSILWAGVN